MRSSTAVHMLETTVGSLFMRCKSVLVIQANGACRMSLAWRHDICIGTGLPHP